MTTRHSNLKDYELIYQDKQGNELMKKYYECFNLKEATKTAKYLLATTSMNDLHKIVVRRIYS